MHGLKASEGVQEITWSGRLDDDFYDEFVFTAYLPAALKTDAPLYLPTLQTCEKGSQNWAQIPAAGQDAHSLELPAPLLRLAAASGGAMAQMSGMVHAGDLMIATPWTRATPPGAKVAGGYLTITNDGKVADRLTGGSFDGGGRIEVHEMSMGDGVMKMRPLDGGVEIKPGATVKLEPGGYHLMMMDLARPLAKGDKVKAHLEFEKAGRVDVELDVNAVGASAPAMGHAH
jgi:copper(I)-binding protein